MAVKLIIEFHGLCLFVPDEENQVMHVLLPELTGMHATHMLPHVAAFHFAKRHNADGGNRSEEPFTGLRCRVGSGATGGINLNLPSEVLNVADLLGVAGIKRDKLAGKQQHVKSHVILTAGGYQCHGDVGIFEIDGAPARATSTLRWVMDLPDDATLDWTFESLDGTSTTTPVGLVPLKKKIRLFMMHAPENENALPICDEDEPNHFPAYYPLFGAQGPTVRCTGDFEDGDCSRGVLDILPEDPEAAAAALAGEVKEAKEAFHESGAFGFAPNVFTCMLGQTKIDPTS